MLILQYFSQKINAIYNPCIKNKLYLESLHKKQDSFTIPTLKTGHVYNPYIKNKVLFTIPTKNTRFNLQSLQKKNKDQFTIPTEKNKAQFTIPTKNTRLHLQSLQKKQDTKGPQLLLFLDFGAKKVRLKMIFRQKKVYGSTFQT